MHLVLNVKLKAFRSRMVAKLKALGSGMVVKPKYLGSGALDLQNFHAQGKDNGFF